MPTRPRSRTSGDGPLKSASVAEHARHHARTRKAHAQELAEDYVEAVAELIEETGRARVTDLARRLGVTHVSIVRTVARLQREGLLETEPYRSIGLTAQGAALAERVRRRHELVVRFLVALGVDAATARADAEGIEHHVSEATLAAFERFVGRSEGPARAGKTAKKRTS